MVDEQTLLNHYNLTTPLPTSWPAEKDESDASDDEKHAPLSRHYVRRSKSRYSALERHAHDRRSLVPGSERLPHGQENIPQKDETDPLGGGDSVVRTLRKKGLPVEDDMRLSRKPLTILQCLAERFQEIDFFSHPRLFLQTCFSLKFTPKPQRRNSCRALSPFPAP